MAGILRLEINKTWRANGVANGHVNIIKTVLDQHIVQMGSDLMTLEYIFTNKVKMIIPPVQQRSIFGNIATCNNIPS